MLDLDALLAPIPGAAPCGQDMLFSAQFDALQKAREHDDPSLEQGEWVIDLKEADWPFVITESQKLLRNSTKDLRLGVWLADALASVQGFAGLDDGYRLLSGLCERWWDDLHPLAEDGDMDMRIGSVSWLASRSVELLRLAPIVNDGQLHYGAQIWETALGLDQAIKRGSSNIDELTRGKVTSDQFERVRRATPAKFFLKLHGELLACEESVAHFERVFDERTNAQGPSFAPVKEGLASIRATVERFAREAGVSFDRNPSVVSSATQGAAPTPGSGQQPQGRVEPVFSAPPVAAAPPPREGVHTRAQAIARLKEVAEFFESTEPSSPTAYMAKKAALWAEMPLHAWLRNVIKNEQELAQLEDLLGIAAARAQDS